MHASCLRSVVPLLPVTVLALVLTGCTLLQPRPTAGSDDASVQPVSVTHPRPSMPPRVAAVEEAREQVAKGHHEEAVATLDHALAAKKGPEDALLMELGVVLASPEVADYERASEVLERLLKKHPGSSHRFAAHALADLLATLKQVNADNEALRQDLKQILDIDLEAERRRRGG